jgi:hypothetical protein
MPLLCRASASHIVALGKSIGHATAAMVSRHAMNERDAERKQWKKKVV